MFETKGWVRLCANTGCCTGDYSAGCQSVVGNEEVQTCGPGVEITLQVANNVIKNIKVTT